jgi:hypothetical protein
VTVVDLEIRENSEIRALLKILNMRARRSISVVVTFDMDVTYECRCKPQSASKDYPETGTNSLAVFERRSTSRSGGWMRRSVTL